MAAPGSVEELRALVGRLEAAVVRLEKAGGTAAVASAASGSAGLAEAASVSAFETLMQGAVQDFNKAAGEVGDAAAQMAQLLVGAFAAQLAFLRIASQHAPPASPKDLEALLKPTSDKMVEIGTLKSKYRGQLEPHLAMVSEGVLMLSWVNEPKTPVPFVDEAGNAGKFYGNRVRMMHKGDAKHAAYVAKFEDLITALKSYVKEYHTTGLVWNKNAAPAPKDALTGAASVTTSAQAGPAAGGPPAAPPPPPAGFMEEALKNAAAASNQEIQAGKGGGSQALFAELSKGDGVTAGLRHVTKDMKTKNQPKEEPRAPAVAAPKSAPAASPSAAATAAGKPRIELDGKKWIVENIANRSEDPVIISETHLSQVVYIYRCNNTVVQIQGKVNAITIDGCSKCGVIFDNVVSCCEVVNGTSIQVQVNGKVPSIAIDKTSGCIVFLSKDSLQTEIVSSKSSEMNVSIPSGPNGDYEEIPLPEQYISKVVNGKIHTAPTSHA